jgi:hypothetical protein
MEALAVNCRRLTAFPVCPVLTSPLHAIVTPDGAASHVEMSQLPG